MILRRDARRALLNIQQAADSDVVRVHSLDFKFARGALGLSEHRMSDAITSVSQPSPATSNLLRPAIPFDLSSMRAHALASCDGSVSCMLAAVTPPWR